MNTQAAENTNNEALEEQQSKQRLAELDAAFKVVLTELRPLQSKTWDDYDKFIEDLSSDDATIAGPAQFEQSFEIEDPSNIESGAQLGYPLCQYAAARLYEEGVSLHDFHTREILNKKDLLVSIYWYAQAEKEGFELATGNADRLFKQLLEAAESGDPDYTYDVATCHETGFQGLIEKTPQSAISWYQKSAAAGNPIAHLTLGEIYYFGAYGLELDLEKALEHYDHYIQWFFSQEASKQLPLCLLRGNAMSFGAMFGQTPPQKATFNLAAQLFESEDINRLELIIECFANSWVYGEEHEDGISERDSYTAWESCLLTAIYHYTNKKNLDKFRNDLQQLFIFDDDAEITSVGETDNAEDDLAFRLTLRTGLIGLGDAGLRFSLGEITDRTPADPNQLRCRRMEAVLREAAEKGVSEASLLLGLILVNSSPADSPDASEGKAWIETGVRNNDILSCMWYASLGRRGLIQCDTETIKIALRRVIYADYDETSHLKMRTELSPRQYKSEIFDEEYFQTLRQRAVHQLADIEREEAELRAKEQAQRDMLSYLTHTLNNTLSSGPEAARQAMRILGSELYENNREYKAINNIATMFSTFLFAQQLLKTFKLYIADPDLLRQNWQNDKEGEASITMVLALALRQTLSQVVFSANHQAALQRLLPHKEAGAIKATRKSFMEEIVSLDVDAGNAATVFGWVGDHLGTVVLSLDPAAELHFHTNSTRFTFFFSSFSELIYNALKYSDGARPIEIGWSKHEDHYLFSCRNSWTADSLQSAEGSGKGLVFLKRLVEMLGASLHTQSDAGVFSAEIRFPLILIEGEQ